MLITVPQGWHRQPVVKPPQDALRLLANLADTTALAVAITHLRNTLGLDLICGTVLCLEPTPTGVPLWQTEITANADALDGMRWWSWSRAEAAATHSIVVDGLITNLGDIYHYCHWPRAIEGKK